MQRETKRKELSVAGLVMVFDSSPVKKWICVGSKWNLRGVDISTRSRIRGKIDMG